jgi:hypothetical protein
MRTLLLFLALSFLFVNTANAQARITEPLISPVTPPELENTGQILTPPTAPAAEFPVYEKERGIFKWDVDTELNGSYLFQNLILGMAALGGNARIKDPNRFGEKLGLAEDALEYKAGLALAFGLDINGKPAFSIPLHCGAALYFKEGSFYGYDPFVGAGLNLNLIGSDFRMGGFGYQLYGGVLMDLGWPAGKTGFAFGYNKLSVEGSRLAQGYYISASQPIKL